MKPVRFFACALLVVIPLAFAHQNHVHPGTPTEAPVIQKRIERRQGSTTTSTPTSTPTETSTSTTPTTTPTDTTTTTPTTTPPSDTPTNTPDTGTPTGPPLPTGDQTSTPSDTTPTDTNTSTDTNTRTRPTTTTPTGTPTNSAPTTPAPSGLSQGTVIGLAVTGGIAGLALVAFIVWKFTQKRFSNFDDDADPIKWPELQNESHALPVRSTGGSGIGERSNDPSGIFSNTTATNSSADLPHDPYGVPPLPPQHDRNVGPYRDDPNQAYYDPYHGPVPQSLGGAYVSGSGGPGSIRSRSPGPNVPFEDPYASGRRSPGPALAYDQGRSSPAPGAYGGVPYEHGRGSPAPGAYGGMPYDQGRRSPGPAQAYGGPGGRRSPGPAQAYGGYDDPYGGTR